MASIRSPSHASDVDLEATVPESTQLPAVLSDGQIRAKSWNYTWNNYTAENVQYLKTLSGVSYHVLGYEEGEETHTPHIQGFITFVRTKTRKQVLNILKNQFVEKTRNRAAMEEYCKKSGEFDVIDNRKRSSAGETARAVLSLIAQTGDCKGVIQDYPGYYIRHMRNLEEIARRHCDASRPRPVVDWFFGGTGSGKSYNAFLLGGPDAYWHSGTYRYARCTNVNCRSTYFGEYEYRAIPRTRTHSYVQTVPLGGGRIIEITRLSSSMTYVPISVSYIHYFDCSMDSKYLVVIAFACC